MQTKHAVIIAVVLAALNVFQWMGAIKHTTQLETLTEEKQRLVQANLRLEVYKLAFEVSGYRLDWGQYGQQGIVGTHCDVIGCGRAAPRRFVRTSAGTWTWEK